MRNPKPIDDEAKHDREQIQRLYAAMRVELEQLTARANVVLERLKVKAETKSPPLRLVKHR